MHPSLPLIKVPLDNATSNVIIRLNPYIYIVSSFILFTSSNFDFLSNFLPSVHIALLSAFLCRNENCYLSPTKFTTESIL